MKVKSTIVKALIRMIDELFSSHLPIQYHQGIGSEILQLDLDLEVAVSLQSEFSQ
jgi:hypothetical protein